MIAISAVIITFNEERNIARCLCSLQGVADEILVIDSFSSDRTPEICRARGVRFHQRAFEGYSDQKNWGNAQATHDVILSLDADEALSYPLRRSIAAIKSRWDKDAFYFNRLASYCGAWVRHGGWYPDRKIRLWDRRKGRWDGSLIHETLVLQPGATTGRLQGDLLHYTFSTLSQHIHTIDRYTDLKAKQTFAAGRRTHPLKMLLAPGFKFFSMYLLKLGFLDGMTGLMVCGNSAFASWLQEAKLWQIQKGS